MCVVCAKYFPDVGWAIAKNRDRNYKPDVRIRKSFRRNVERLYIWDEKTKYTEGVNEYGVGIISSSVAVKKDEKEGQVATKSKVFDGETKKRVFYSPDGLRIRTALFETDALSATKKLIELEIPGNTIIADQKRCFILEGAFTDNEYLYKAIEIPQDKIVVRTNHGIMLPWTGYSKDVPSQTAARNSSDVRYKKVVKALKEAQNLDGMLEALSDTSDPNPQLNPLRLDPQRKVMRTTGQIVVVPSINTLHYRSIWCTCRFDLDKLNKGAEKTFFEVVSTRKLISFKEKAKGKEK